MDRVVYGRADSMFRELRGHLRGMMSDADAVMTLNRLVGGLLGLPFTIEGALTGRMQGMPVPANLAYLALGLGIWVHGHRWPQYAFWRRVLALPFDVAAASYGMYLGGGATAWLAPSYLWIIFGNGFRFGPRFLLGAMGLSLAGFAAVACASPFWAGTGTLSVGIFVGLIILPLYALALIRRLSVATRQAEAASRAKSLFLASVSHELRTPLNAIIGMGALLEDSALTPDQEEMSGTIMTSARSLLGLIDGVLDLSRIEADRMPVLQADFDLARTLAELRTILLGRARQKGLALHVALTCRTPLLLRGDARRLHEILLNLVGNALKFTHAGGVTIAVDAVAVGPEEARLLVEVTDTGIGIALEAQSRIFENFTQADETILNRYGGTGLGLAITRKFVELLGGEIGVRSSPGEGSTFWFEIPFARQAPAEIPTTEAGSLRAFARDADAPPLAPLLDRLRAAGVRVEVVEAWPEEAGAPTEIEVPCLAFAAGAVKGGAPIERLAAAQALRFVAIDAARAAAPLPRTWQRAFATVVAADIDGAALDSVLHFLRLTAGRPAAAQEAAAPREAGADARAAAPAPRQDQLRVLVADDNTVNQRVLQRIIGGAGHKVRIVGDGEQALDALVAEQFDIALFDVNMPRIDGIEAAKLYRMGTRGTADEVPIVALTADAMDETRVRCLEAGMRACLVKPVEPSRLLAILSDIVHAARGEAPLPRSVPTVSEPAEPAPAPHLDEEVMASLRALGGEEFLAEVATSFNAEAAARLDGLRAALARGDVPDFRFQAHGLRSIAANMGARALCDLCLPYQSVSGEELRKHGVAYLGRIAEELAQVEQALVGNGLPRRAAQLSLLEMLPTTPRRGNPRNTSELAGPTAA